MKSTKLVTLSLIVLSLLLGACGGSNQANSDIVLTQAAEIAYQALTETAAAAPPTSTPTEVPPTPTETPQPTATPQPTQESQTLPQQQQQQPVLGSGSVPCFRANLEYESHPDGIEIPAGHAFTKVWRLKNTGSCTWKPSFYATWIQGDLLGAEAVEFFTATDIPPNGYAMVEVSMRAPTTAGNYRGYWMLHGDAGTFGVGNGGKEWFWVDIKVLPPPPEH